MNIKSVPKKQLWGIELNLISLLFSSISPVLNKFSLTSLRGWEKTPSPK